MENKRLGRGEALRRLLESQGEAPKGRSSASVTERESRDKSPSLLKPAGRSALFAELSKKKDVPSPKPEQVIRPGRGRALLASLAVSSEADTEVAKITKRVAEIPRISESQVQSTEPVVMKGSYGNEISLGVNYVRLKVAEGKGLYQYDVQFEPSVDYKGARFALLNQFKEVIGETRLFDGGILYLPIMLPQKVTHFSSVLPSDGSKVTITITFTNQRRFGDPEAIHLYNILFRRIMVILGLALHGKNFYDPKAAMPIPLHKLEVWPGYITAIDEFEDGLMLCCDASHRVLRNQTVLELMQDLENSNRAQWKDEFVNLILGQSVLTRYNNKVYRIDDISFDESPNDSFEKNNGEKMKYHDYYKQQYNITLKDRYQPLLKSKVKTKLRGKSERQLVSLVPELCFLTGITDTMRADMRVMKDITQCICVSPNQRHYALTQFIRNVKSSQDARKILSDWGLSFDDAFMNLSGRMLPPINITFGGFTAKGNMEANWSGASNKNSVLTSVDIRNWGVVCTKRDDKSVLQFLDQMIKLGPQVGLRISKPQLLCINDDRTDNYIRTLRSTLSKDNPQVMMIVFPVARTDKYSAVKKLCCIESPVPSQAILSRTVRKAATARTVALKVALQMNCKLGGTLWSVPIPVESTMVCGLDTYHDPKRRAPSVGALVASLNQPLTRWYSKIYNQNPGLEFVDGLEVSMLSCLQKHREVNGRYPEQIVLFRDGVSDGQLPMCKDYEIPQILKSCRRISPEYNPKLLLVVVQKRINTRIFSLNEREMRTSGPGGGGYGNPPPGTIVDHTITRRYLYDFFLVSQHVTQGTVSPTHYIVLYNSTNMTPDQVQRFSYTLTHLYYNWPGTIRVPAPCQYAHKLAYLVGENIHKEASEILADKLFYL